MTRCVDGDANTHPRIVAFWVRSVDCETNGMQQGRGMAAAKARPKEPTRLRKAASQFGRVARDVIIGVLVGMIRDVMSRIGLP
jgi:hypothetical protein